MMTKAGGGNLRKTMERKFGSYEAWKAHLKEIASKGGKAGKGHAFAHGKLDPSEMGKIAGRISKGNWSPERRKRMSLTIKAIRARERAERDATRTDTAN
jgi:general stress protein YciG